MEVDPLDGLVDILCVCGERIYVTSNSADQVWECHSCKLPFTLFVQKTPDGRTVAVPMFVDGSPRLDEELPDPPEEMTLLCTCGNPLRVTKRLYNHRVKCPHCNVRMALVLSFDTKRTRYTLEARNLDGPSMGDTHLLVRAVT